MKKTILAVAAMLLVMSQAGFAQRTSYVNWQNQDVDSMLIWFKDGVPTDLSKLKDLEFKRSHVRPRAVIVDKATQLDNSIEPKRAVFANLPIGADDLNSGLPSGNFDEDVFSMWQYTKIHGNWSNSWFVAPAAYADAAHKHGTAVLSSWFFNWDWNYVPGKSKAEDANAYQIELMTQKDGDGNLIYAPAMDRLFAYFGLDGINYNPECNFNGAARDVQKLHVTLQDLAQARKNDFFHIGWYNFMSNEGKIGSGRATLNASVQDWYYKDGKFVCNAFMTDYAWSVSNMNTSVTTAINTGNPNGGQDAYGGMWLVDIKNTYMSGIDQQKGMGIGLWGEHKNNRFFNHRSGDDLAGLQKSYQNRLEWFYSGKTQNPKAAKSNTLYTSAGSAADDSYLTNFHGIAKHIAERSTVQGNFPFATNFNLGNGIGYYDRGVKTYGNWYNLGAQDMVPTYRWLVTNESGAVATNIKASFSHDDAFLGGSSLLLAGTARTTATDITLYRTKLSPIKVPGTTAVNAPQSFSVEALNECATKISLKMVWSMSTENATRLVYNDEVNVDHFEIFIKEGGIEKQVAHTTSWAHYLPDIALAEGALSFDIGVRAVSSDLATKSAITWQTITRNPAVATVACGGSAYCDATNYTTSGTAINATRCYFKNVKTTGATHNIDLIGQATAEMVEKDGAQVMEVKPGFIEAYVEFSEDTIRVAPGGTFTLVANEGVAAANGTEGGHLLWSTYRAWVDWNRDAEFTIDEKISEDVGGEGHNKGGWNADDPTDVGRPSNFNSVGNPSVVNPTIDVVVPTTAKPGLTRMRIRYSDAWGARPASCGSTLAGYTADILIVVAGAVEPTPPAAPITFPTLAGAAAIGTTPSAYLVYKVDGGTASSLYLTLQKNNSEVLEYPVGTATAAGEWTEANISLANLASSDIITNIGLRVKADAENATYKVNVGELRVQPGTYPSDVTLTSDAAKVSNVIVTANANSEAGGVYNINAGEIFKVTFKLVNAADVPAVTVGGSPVVPTYETSTQVYTLSLQVTQATTIHLTAGSPRNVSVVRESYVELVSGTGIPAGTDAFTVAENSAFELMFKLADKYENPVVVLGTTARLPYTLAAPNSAGEYTVLLNAVSVDSAIYITATRIQYRVQATAGYGITITSANTDLMIDKEAPFVLTFALQSGYQTPVITVNGAVVATPTAVDGVYTLSIASVTEALNVVVSASSKQTSASNLIEDTYIDGGAPTTARGTANNFGIKNAGSDATTFEPYLKINVKDLDLSSIISAKLRFNNQWKGDAGNTNVTWTIQEVTNDWRESTLTWNTTPKPTAVGTNSLSLQPYNIIPEARNNTTTAWYTIDITDLVKNVATDTFSLHITSTAVTGADPGMFVNSLNANASYRPQLQLFYAPSRYPIQVTASAGITLETPANDTVVYGDRHVVQFRLSEHYTLPAAPTGYAYYPNNSPVNGVYTIRTSASAGVTAQPADLTLTASPEQFNVTVSAANVTITSPSGSSPYSVDYGSPFELKFTLDAGYENPQVTGGILTGPDGDGVYTVTIASVTSAASISIAASIKLIDVTLTSTNVTNLAVTSGHSDKGGGVYSVIYGDTIKVAFKVSNILDVPAATVNGSSVVVSFNGVDTYIVAHKVTETATINITAATAKAITVTKGDYVTIVSQSGQTTATEGVYNVAEGSPFTLTFSLAAGYETPVVTGGTLTGPDGAGIYTVSIPSVTADVALGITATLQQLAVTVAATNVTVTSPTGSSPYSVAYGSSFELKFTLNAGYENPQVTGGTLTGADGSGVYTVSIASVTSAAAINITASLKQLAVTVAATGVTVTSPSGSSPYSIAYGSPFELKFTLLEGYENPVVTGGTLTGPDGNGVYTVYIASVTEDVSINAAASLQQLPVAVSATGVTVTSPTGSSPYSVAYGSPFELKFTLNAGFEKPEVTGGTLTGPDENGVCTVYIASVTSAVSIGIVATAVSTGIGDLAPDAPQLYPNPASTTVSFVNTDKATIYTLTGSVVGVYTGASANISALAAGVYVVKLEKGGAVVYAKLIVSR